MRRETAGGRASCEALLKYFRWGANSGGGGTAHIFETFHNFTVFLSGGDESIETSNGDRDESEVYVQVTQSTMALLNEMEPQEGEKLCRGTGCF